MKIISIGTDIIKISRIADLYNKKPEFAEKILSEDELKTSRITSEYLARRWAGKEAVAKCIGTGFRENCNLREISILNDEHGKPYVKLSGATEEYVTNNFGKTEFHISLSDDEYAVAFCVLVGLT